VDPSGFRDPGDGKPETSLERVKRHALPFHARTAGNAHSMKRTAHHPLHDWDAVPAMLWLAVALMLALVLLPVMPLLVGH
jgi:hypothetical protein